MPCGFAFCNILCSHRGIGLLAALSLMPPLATHVHQRCREQYAGALSPVCSFRVTRIPGQHGHAGRGLLALFRALSLLPSIISPSAQAPSCTCVILELSKHALQRPSPSPGRRASHGADSCRRVACAHGTHVGGAVPGPGQGPVRAPGTRRHPAHGLVERNRCDWLRLRVLVVASATSNRCDFHCDW